MNAPLQMSDVVMQDLTPLRRGKQHRAQRKRSGQGLNEQDGRLRRYATKHAGDDDAAQKEQLQFKQPGAFAVDTKTPAPCRAAGDSAGFSPASAAHADAAGQR